MGSKHLPARTAKADWHITVTLAAISGQSRDISAARLAAESLRATYMGMTTGAGAKTGATNGQAASDSRNCSARRHADWLHRGGSAWGRVWLLALRARSLVDPMKRSPARHGHDPARRRPNSRAHGNNYPSAALYGVEDGKIRVLVVQSSWQNARLAQELDCGGVQQSADSLNHSAWQYCQAIRREDPWL